MCCPETVGKGRKRWQCSTFDDLRYGQLIDVSLTILDFRFH